MALLSFNTISRKNIILAARSYSKTGKFTIAVLIFAFFGSGLMIIRVFNSYFLANVPHVGGIFAEGIIGSPRFINPVLAESDADKDLVSLVYSGLLRISSDGTLIPDLAESYSISEDGLEYTFLLRPDLTFHDGAPVTSEDVRFTIEKLQDPGLKSPKRGSWEGVSVEAPDARTVRFRLSAPYAPFLGNAIVGILPSHLFLHLSADEWTFSTLNTRPIGSGPYRVIAVEETSSGLPEYYDLAAFKDFALGEPYISTLRISFYANENELFADLGEGRYAISALSPERAEILEEKDLTVMSSPLPRIFGVFWNQNEQDIFTDLAVRKALDKSIDREYITRTILRGRASAAYGPFPPGTSAYSEMKESDSSSAAEALAEARNMLLEAGWTLNETSLRFEKKEKAGVKTLSFVLSTSDTPELKAVAEALKRDWETLGANVEIKIFESGDLNQKVIRPRKYDALLFGEIVGREPDPYAFWHSSQRLDPGLNIALYANRDTDALFEEIRETPLGNHRLALFRKFENQLKEDIPAAFIYSPEFLYAIPSSVKNVKLPPIVYPSERFSEIFKWNIETDKVWKIFAD